MIQGTELNTVTAQKGVFIRNKTQLDIFDLTTNSGTKLPFHYFRLYSTLPVRSLNKRPVLMAESQRNEVEVLKTVLFKTKKKNISSGYIYDPENDNNSLILFCSENYGNRYIVYFFYGYDPMDLTQVLNKISDL
jgi:hypothetical protein